MALPTLQDLNKLRENRNERKKVIASLKLSQTHSQDIRLHTEAEVSDNPSNPAHGRFMKRVDGYLVKNKYRVFKKYHRYPLNTTATCSSILDQLGKVFEGKNPVRSSVYSTDRLEMDFLQYLKAKGFHKQWRTDSLRALGSGHNDILIVDMPEDLPEPYFYFLSIEDVLDMDVDMTSGQILWVQFHQTESQVAHISTDGWQVLNTDGKGGEFTSIEREAENKTGMDVAWFWWEVNMNAKNKILKKSPFTDFITKLDWLEVWSVYKRMLDSFASNPVTWSIEEECDFRDAERGIHCDGGYLKRTESGSFVRGESSYINNGYVPCPKCSDKRFVAPGSHMEVEAPDKETDMRPPFGIVGIDKAALDNSREELVRLIEELVKGITGGGQEPMNQEAINVTQVSALFEGWTGNLRKIKKSFESSEAKLLEVMAALRYGRGGVLQMAINYGSEFYLLSEQESLIFYTAARSHKLPDYILDFLFDEYLQTKFRLDKKGLERAKMLMAIEPFKHITKEEILNMTDQLEVSREDLYLKLNFGSIVQQFEIQNGSVADFGVNMKTDNKGDSFAQRIEKIKSVMLSYIPVTEPAT